MRRRRTRWRLAHLSLFISQFILAHELPHNFFFVVIGTQIIVATIPCLQLGVLSRVAVNSSSLSESLKLPR